MSREAQGGDSWGRAVQAIVWGSSLVAVAFVIAACRETRGGEPIPIERRTFHEVAPTEVQYAEKPDAADYDAGEPDADKPPPPVHHAKRDAGAAWSAPRGGYLEQLGSEFRRLRPVPLTEYDAGHTKGRKRQVMNELGTLLVNASRDTVLRIMGSPDNDVRPGSRDWGPTRKQDGRAAERLLYQWRGWKDYLLFELDANGHVLRSEWFLSTQ